MENKEKYNINSYKIKEDIDLKDLDLSKEDVTQRVKEYLSEKKSFKKGIELFHYPLEKDGERFLLSIKIIKEEENPMYYIVEGIAVPYKSKEKNEKSLEELAKLPVNELSVGECLRLKRAGMLDSRQL